MSLRPGSGSEPWEAQAAGQGSERLKFSEFEALPAMGCGRDDGGKLHVYPRAQSILAANLGCLCEIGPGARYGNRGSGICVHSAMGTSCM